MKIAEIYQESDTFFEFPTPNHSHVTTTSAILFARHIAEQAHRSGWEQAKRKAVEKVEYIHKNSLGSKILLAVAADVIASMEYKKEE